MTLLIIIIDGFILTGLMSVILRLNKRWLKTPQDDYIH